jgi:hypothetical protein
MPVDPDPIFTPRGLAAFLKQQNPLARAAVGERMIRRAIRSGELKAARLGNADVVRLSDWTACLDRLAAARQPAPIERTRAERVEAAVLDRIRRERGA